MLNNFIYAKQKSLFEEKLTEGEILDEAIVFIEDTKEIWNHGTYFGGNSVDLSNIEEIVSKIKTDGNGFQYLNDKGEYSIPQIIVNSEEELNSLDVVEGTEAVIVYPEKQYTEEDFNNLSLEELAFVAYITIEGFDTSKVYTNSYTTSGSFDIPGYSPNDGACVGIRIAFDENGISNIWHIDVLGADRPIYNQTVGWSDSSISYNLIMTFIQSELEENQLNVFMDFLNSTIYKFTSPSYSNKMVYHNLKWDLNASLSIPDNLSGIYDTSYSRIIGSFMGKSNLGLVRYLNGHVVIGWDFIENKFVTFDGTTIRKYVINGDAAWMYINPYPEESIILSDKNTKTINGESILGEGDITVTSNSDNKIPEIVEVPMNGEYGISFFDSSLNPNYPPMESNKIYIATHEVESGVTIQSITPPTELYGRYELNFTTASGEKYADLISLSVPDYIKWEDGLMPTVEIGKNYSLVINASKLGSDYIYTGVLSEFYTPTIITFSVDSESWQAEEGMTWDEFLRSPYSLNTRFYSEGTSIFYSGLPIALNGVYQYKQDYIVANGNYQYSGGSN